MADTLSKEEMFLAAQKAQAAQAGNYIIPANTSLTMTPEQMHEAFLKENGGMGHEAAAKQASVAAMMPPSQDAQLPLAPPLASTPTPTPAFDPNSPLANPPAPSDPSLNNPLANMALGEMQKGRAEDVRAVAHLNANAAMGDKGFADEQQGLADAAQTAQAKSDALSENDKAATQAAMDNEQKLAEINAQGQKAAEAQMVRLNAAIDASQHAEVHDFWQDKSTGARILGILSQAFAGAANGLANNPGAVTPLDRVIAADLQRQEINLNQTNKKVDQARSVLSQIYQDTGSRQQAQAGMYIAAWKRVTQQGLEVANKFKTPEAQAQFEQLKGLSEQRQAEASNKAFELMHNSAVQQYQHGADSFASAEAAQAATQKQLTGENEKSLIIAGTSTPVDNRTYEKFKESDQAFRGIIADQQEIRHVLREMKADHLGPVEAYEQYKILRANMLSSERKRQGTGAALSAQELKNVEAMLPDFVSANAPGFAEFMAKTGEQQMQRLMRSVARSHFSKIDGALANVKLDVNDPLYGNYVKDYIREKAIVKAEDNQ